jgi:hypothetical protein
MIDFSSPEFESSNSQLSLHSQQLYSGVKYLVTHVTSKVQLRFPLRVQPLGVSVLKLSLNYSLPE